MAAPVSYGRKEGVARITLDRPESFNALNLELLEDLSARVDEAVHDDRVGALVLTGAGKAFSAGGDVRALSGLASSSTPRQDASMAIARMHHVLTSLYRCPKPVIAAVNGATAGAGIGLMLTADLIWAGQSAHFTLAFTQIGASPDGGTTFLLPRVVGPKMAAELLLTNRRLDAEEARSLGLVNRVFEDGVLLEKAEATARCLAVGPAQAFASAKELLRKSLLQGYEGQLEEERQAMARAVVGTEFAEGVEAFLEKRPPKFR